MGESKEYWNSIANHVAKYDKVWFSRGLIGNETWFHEYNRKKTQKQIFSVIPNQKYPLILDVGCGIGQWSVLLALKLEADVIGIDFSSRMVELARRRAAMLKVQNVKFQVMNVENMIFENDFFDLVNCVTVLQHIPKEEVWKKAIKEIVRVTKTDGTILVLETAPKKFAGERKCGDCYVHLENEYIEQFGKNGAFFTGQKLMNNALSFLLLKFGEGLLYLYARGFGKKSLDFYSSDLGSYKPKLMYLPCMFTITLSQIMDTIPRFKFGSHPFRQRRIMGRTPLLNEEKILLFRKARK